MGLLYHYLLVCYAAQVGIVSRRFGTAYRFKGQAGQVLDQHTLYNNPEEGRPPLHREGSLKSRCQLQGIKELRK
jgi:hypothetical protein